MQDELLHADDLEEIFKSTLGPNTVTHRELKYLVDAIALPSKKMKNTIEYKKLTDLVS